MTISARPMRALVCTSGVARCASPVIQLIQFRVPVLFLVQVSVAVVVATALAGVYPAARAARLVVTQEE